MSNAPFQPDERDRAIMVRGWAVLSLVVAQLGVMARAAPEGAARLALLRLLRVGEGLARRMLVTRALMRALPVVRPLAARARRRLIEIARRRRLDPRDVRYKPPKARKPLFRLTESLVTFESLYGASKGKARPEPPALRVMRHGILTVRTLSTAGNPQLQFVEGRGILPADGVEQPKPPDRLIGRLAALKDVAAHPARHARRMARWIVRQRRQRHGRLSPLRPGRPPGSCLKLAWRDETMSMLFDAAHLSTRALAHAPRRHSPDN